MWAQTTSRSRFRTFPRLTHVAPDTSAGRRCRPSRRPGPDRNDFGVVNRPVDLDLARMHTHDVWFARALSLPKKAANLQRTSEPTPRGDHRPSVEATVSPQCLDVATTLRAFAAGLLARLEVQQQSTATVPPLAVVQRGFSALNEPQRLIDGQAVTLQARGYGFESRWLH